MARTDRGVAQRYAAKKRKKRVTPARMPSSDVERSQSTEELELPPSRTAIAELTRPEPRRGPTPVYRSAPVERPRAPSRRPFSTYVQEYAYVVSDLRRVALTAVILVLVLLALEFVLR